MDVKPTFKSRYDERNQSRKNLDRLPQSPFEKNTVRSYQAIIDQLCQDYGDVEIAQLSSDEILLFLNRISDGNKPCTNRVRYSQLSSFFNFVRNNVDPNSANPCNTPMIRKLSRQTVLLSPSSESFILHQSPKG